MLMFARILIIATLMSLSMSSHAGNFFPPEYKTFPFHEGDLLVSKRSDGKFAVNKILKVDRFDYKTGDTINIQGKVFAATEEDFLLVISSAFGASEFNTFEEARAAAQTGKWTVQLALAPNRAPGAAAGQTLVGHAPVSKKELESYDQWRQQFDRGNAGIF